MIFLTTTAVEIDEELLNRCIVLTVDEGREQTRAIHSGSASADARGLLARQERAADLAAAPERAAAAPAAGVVNPYAADADVPGSTRRGRGAIT